MSAHNRRHHYLSGSTWFGRRPAMSAHAAPTLCLTNKQDVDDLIADLRAARRKSLRTGGAYLVHRAGDCGEDLLKVRVHIRLDEALAAAARRDVNRKGS